MKQCYSRKAITLNINNKKISISFQLMKLGKAVIGKAGFGKVMKLSFYGQFVAGENRQDIKPAIHRMHQFGVKSILDYSVEEDIPEEEAEKMELDACKREGTPENYDPAALPHKGDYKGIYKSIFNYLACPPSSKYFNY